MLTDMIYFPENNQEKKLKNNLMFYMALSQTDDLMIQNNEELIVLHLNIKKFSVEVLSTSHDKKEIDEVSLYDPEELFFIKICQLVYKDMNLKQKERTFLHEYIKNKDWKSKNLLRIHQLHKVS